VQKRKQMNEGRQEKKEKIKKEELNNKATISG
jgi:hypothetical protein